MYNYFSNINNFVYNYYFLFFWLIFTLTVIFSEEKITILLSYTTLFLLLYVYNNVFFVWFNNFKKVFLNFSKLKQLILKKKYIVFNFWINYNNKSYLVENIINVIINLYIVIYVYIFHYLDIQFFSKYINLIENTNIYFITNQLNLIYFEKIKKSKNG
jgi:hypothetical protein